MRLSAFIEGQLDALVEEWERFARTILPAAESMSGLALRDHCRSMLAAIAKDIESDDSEVKRTAQAEGLVWVRRSPQTAAALHGAFRQISGFTAEQMVSEFVALRASVLLCGVTPRGLGIEGSRSKKLLALTQRSIKPSPNPSLLTSAAHKRSNYLGWRISAALRIVEIGLPVFHPRLNPLVGTRGPIHGIAQFSR